jgi:hypothetical protein
VPPGKKEIFEKKLLQLSGSCGEMKLIIMILSIMALSTMKQ